MARHMLLPTLCVVLMSFLLSCGQKDAEAPVADAPDSGGILPVEAIVVRSRAVAQTITLAGSLQPIHSVDIVAEIQGEIETIHRELGEAVAPRDTLARIDDRIPHSHYRQAQAQVLSAETNLKIARLNAKSDGELFNNGDISRLIYENSLLAVKAADAGRLSALASLDLAEKQYRDTRITSPIPGLISRKHVEPGAMVTPGTPLFRVIDLSVLKIDLPVSQDAVGRVRKGSPATVTVSGLNDRRFDGAVHAVSPQADERTGAFHVEIRVPNTEARAIRAGMTAKVALVLTDPRPQLAVPDHALVSKNGRRYVYRIQDGTARLTGISVSQTFGAYAAIDSGLAEGDTIVVVGMKRLGVETKVWVEAVD